MRITRAIEPVLLICVALVATECRSRPAPTVEHELQLRPGLFAGFDGTALGSAVTFDNDIYSATCYPMFVVTGRGETIDGPRISGTIQLWIHRAHIVSRRVFVRTCDIEAPFEASSVRIAGHLSRSWFEATATTASGSPGVALRRIEIDGWSEFSDPVFCGRGVAFWSLRKNGELRGHVADLLEPSTNESASFGTMESPGSDNGWGLPPGTWSADCSAATFRTGSGATHVIRIGAR